MNSKSSNALITDLASFFHKMWLALATRFNPETRIALYGCGTIAVPLLDALKYSHCNLKLEYIIDDKPKAPSFMGFQVIRPELADVQVIIIGSDFYESEIRKRVNASFPQQIQVIGISDFFNEFGLSIFDYWGLKRAFSSDTPRHPTVSPDKITKLEAIVICVGYTDFLQWTLPLNMRHFDRLVVVTASDDISTQNVVKRNGAVLVVSDSYRENGAVFNKGKMINAGIAAIDGDGWILLTDADIILTDDFRSYAMSMTPDRNGLYFASRFDIPSGLRVEEWLQNYSTSRAGLSDIRFTDSQPLGYFQLFSPHAPPLKETYPKIYSENFNNAGGVDMHFYSLWENTDECAIVHSGANVLHIPHGSLASNWSGRKSPAMKDSPPLFVPVVSSGNWSQVAYLISTRLISQTPMPDGGYIKFVRCDTGEFIIIRNDSKLPFFTCSRRDDNRLLCGICSGCHGDVTIAYDSEGNALSGWGIGVLTGTTNAARVWNNKSIGFTDFDILHKMTLEKTEKAFLIS